MKIIRIFRDCSAIFNLFRIFVEIMRHKLILLCLITLLLPDAKGETGTFYTLNTLNGLSDNNVYQLLQLDDGRILACTEKKLNIYDGHRFFAIDKESAPQIDLPHYKGHTHLYTDLNNHIWIKNHQKLTCFSLAQGIAVTPSIKGDIDDFYIDSRDKHVWLVKEGKLICKEKQTTFKLPEGYGELQDLDVMEDVVYLFYSSGTISAHRIRDGKQLHTIETYSPNDSAKFNQTSLVIRDKEQFLQIRTGKGNSGFFRISPEKLHCEQLFETTQSLHTIALTPARVAYLTTNDGYFTYHLTNGEMTHNKALHLPDGSKLTTGINTVCPDREGGIWLGTYNQGILYSSPLSGLFETRKLNIKLKPILSGIYLHGELLQTGKTYNKQVLLKETPAYVKKLDFSYSQNNIAFLYTTMNYVNPRQTYYRYRLNGNSDEEWHVVSADSPLPMVDDKGVFYLSLTGLKPGNYTLEVAASTQAEHWENERIHTLQFTIQPPWWSTPWAYTLYIALIISVICLATWLYCHNVRVILKRQAREEHLMARIQELIAQTQNNQQELNIILSKPEMPIESLSTQSWTKQELEFMNRATLLVKQNMANTAYSVEQLAHDLCMERTGLYKKLTALMQKSPTAFIRNIRLQRAAELLENGGYSIAQIAEMTGFCSTSYFSKCFQQQYKCRPSEYPKE